MITGNISVNKSNLGGRNIVMNMISEIIPWKNPVTMNWSSTKLRQWSNVLATEESFFLFLEEESISSLAISINIWHAMINAIWSKESVDHPNLKSVPMMTSMMLIRDFPTAWHLDHPALIVQRNPSQRRTVDHPSDQLVHLPILNGRRNVFDKSGEKNQSQWTMFSQEIDLFLLSRLPKIILLDCLILVTLWPIWAMSEAIQFRHWWLSSSSLFSIWLFSWWLSGAYLFSFPNAQCRF